MAERHKPNILSIPSGKPFLPTLVEALLGGELVPGFPDPADPLSLARATLLLPTRRACRAILDCFMAREAPAVLLPRIRAIGDEGDGDDAFELAPAIDDGFVEIPPAIKPLLRRTTLARFILAWQQSRPPAPHLHAMTAGDAVFLAGELARLIDLVATYGVPWENLDAILPLDLQEHWQVMADFLRLAREDWPRFLANLQAIDPAERRRLVMEVELARLAALPDEPVIAAGSTGSIPTTAHLLRTIAHLPRGALVLPGLDRHAGPDIWARITGGREAEGAASDPQASLPQASHPQASLAALLRSCRIENREGVRHLDAGLDQARLAREALISRVMWPAEATGAWNIDPPPPAECARALADIALIEAASEEEEGRAIAAAMRFAIETADETIALITPDRSLARRVTAELRRFGLAIDDTAGTPLADTTPGILARLVAEVAASDFAAVPLLALLKHPMVRLGFDEDELREAVTALERAALRGLHPAPGIDGLRKALASNDRKEARISLDQEALARASDLVDRLDHFIGPLATSFKAGGLMPLTEIALRHREALASLIDGADEEDQEKALWLFFDELADTPESGLHINVTDYPAAVERLMQDEPVRGVGSADPRLKVYGLLEARLIAADLVILAGLNEGTWPATAQTDPWLSRSMRSAIALPAPEQRIGLAAHDFTQALGAPRIILSRALKSGNAPSVASRWLQRLAAVAGEELYAGLRQRGDAYLQFAAALDRPLAPPGPCPQPAPCPPVLLRPTSLSVTEIETLIREPYAIYARHVLRLRAIESIGETIDARQRGTLIHECLDKVQRAIAAGVTGRGALLAIGEQEFARFAAWPQVRAFWWPRFERLLDWFLDFDVRRRANAAAVLVEMSGRLILPDTGFTLPGFTLRGRADRIEIAAEYFAIIDFKTGTVPQTGEVRSGFAPQLPIEAAMLRRQAFGADADGAGKRPELIYIKLSGGEPPASESRVRPAKGKDIETLVETSWQGLCALVAGFSQADTPYRSLGSGRHALRYNDYAHLARIAEWGVAADGAEE